MSKVLAGIVVPPAPFQLYPPLLFVMQQDKVFGLIGVPIPTTTVIERKADMSLVILANKGKIIGDVDECRTWKIIKRVNGRRIALGGRREKYQRKPQAETYS